MSNARRTLYNHALILENAFQRSGEYPQEAVTSLLNDIPTIIEVMDATEQQAEILKRITNLLAGNK